MGCSKQKNFLLCSLLVHYLKVTLDSCCSSPFIDQVPWNAEQMLRDWGSFTDEVSRVDHRFITKHQKGCFSPDFQCLLHWWICGNSTNIQYLKDANCRCSHKWGTLLFSLPKCVCRRGTAAGIWKLIGHTQNSTGSPLTSLADWNMFSLHQPRE